MSKCLHPHAGPGAGVNAEALGIKWPPLPWRCPGCGRFYKSHARTVATVDLALFSAVREMVRRADRAAAAAKSEKMRDGIRRIVREFEISLIAEGPPASFLCMECDLAADFLGGAPS